MANEQKSGNTLSKILYYSVVAFSIAVIGGVSWFTVSRLGNIGKSESKKENSSYKDNTSSYNKTDDTSVPQVVNPQSEEAANTVSSEPYEQPQTPCVFTNPVTGAVIKPFSSTSLQYSKTFEDTRIHEGTDIKCPEGSAVMSAYDGVIFDVTEDENYGKTVIIDHTNGVRVKYCGLEQIAVIKGAQVKSGEQIGTTGKIPCESKDEPHIHIEAADESGLGSFYAFFGQSE